MNRSRSLKANHIQTTPSQPEGKKDGMATTQRGKCPYNLEQFETFGNTTRRDRRSRKGAYLVFKRDPRNNSIGARLSLPSAIVDEMHECMGFDDYLEYRISKSARAIALMPGPNGVKISRPSESKGDRGSMSMNVAADTLYEMFGNSHYIYLMVEYYDGVAILRPTGEAEGTVDQEPAS